MIKSDLMSQVGFFDSSKSTINLLDQMENESIWEASYWAFRNKLMPCITMNSPIEKLLKPNQIQVSWFARKE